MSAYQARYPDDPQAVGPGAASWTKPSSLRMLDCWRIALCLILIPLTIGNVAICQASGYSDRIRQGDIRAVDMDQLVKQHRADLMPDLSRAFDTLPDGPKKALVASTLLRLKDSDPRFVRYLIGWADPALQSDIPWPEAFDNDGNRVEAGDRAGGKQSEAFKAWVSSHNADAAKAAEEAVYSLPTRILDLAATGDNRAVPVLRQALRSNNWRIVAVAALGLAQAQDEDSIPMIAAACKRAPKAVAADVASALMYFQDAQAQDTAALYLAPGYRKLLLKQIADGTKRPFD